MTRLLDSLRLLRECSCDLDTAFCNRVVAFFRNKHLALFDEHLRTYLAKVVDNQPFSNHELAKKLGYGSRSAINQIKRGSISLEQLDLIRSTVGRDVVWVSNEERKAQSEVETVRYVHTDELNKQVTKPFERGAYECLEQVFLENLELRELEYENEDAAWAQQIARKVRAVVPTAIVGDAPEIMGLVFEWGPSFLRTKAALHWFTC